MKETKKPKKCLIFLQIFMPNRRLKNNWELILIEMPHFLLMKFLDLIMAGNRKQEMFWVPSCSRSRHDTNLRPSISIISVFSLPFDPLDSILWIFKNHIRLSSTACYDSLESVNLRGENNENYILKNLETFILSRLKFMQMITS